MASKRDQKDKQPSAKTVTPDEQPVSQQVQSQEKGLPANQRQRSSVELNEEVSQLGLDVNLGSKHLGGHTGGDLDGSGGGPAIGETHDADDSTADHYGSREETNAALEGKIANQNTRRLHDPY